MEDHSEFIPDSDVVRITRAKQSEPQKRILDKRGIKYIEDARGFPLVPKSVINGTPEIQTNKPWQPAVLKRHG